MRGDGIGAFVLVAGLCAFGTHQMYSAQTGAPKEAYQQAKLEAVIPSRLDREYFDITCNRKKVDPSLLFY